MEPATRAGLEGWEAVEAAAARVDAALAAGDVRLTMGAEPTFVAGGGVATPEWRLEADGPDKRRRAPTVARALVHRLAPGGVVQLVDGKWYPGEDRPRWQLEVLWRADGVTLWHDPARLADPFARRRPADEARRRPADEEDARVLAEVLAALLGVDPDLLVAAGGSATALPLRRAGDGAWETARWPAAAVELVPGSGPAGNRLPLDRLQPPGWEEPTDYPPDPFSPRDALAPPGEEAEEARVVEFVRTAVVVEPAAGAPRVFLPPLRAEGWAALVPLVEQAAEKTATAVVLEGYPPPFDPRLARASVAPDPGVLEVNVPPAGGWGELVAIHTAVHEAAAGAGLGAQRWLADGRPTGTGGGHHITLGGPTPADSPLLRRPGLLRSLITYFQHHPALSYLFSGLFVGPTSQAPRIDEARHDSLYELEIAFARLDAGEERSGSGGNGAGAPPPWLVDRLLRHLLVDLTGNTHRAEFCVDKLFSPDSPTGRLGLVELRAFESQPDVRLDLLQMLLVRAVVARCWAEPYREPLVRFGTALHDRYLLPHFLRADLAAVLGDLAAHGLALEAAWFEPQLEHRCPHLGTVEAAGVGLELRAALEPWPVLGEEPGAGRTYRPVDSSCERIQARVTGVDPDRLALVGNGRRAPLSATGVPGEHVAGIRFRARSLPGALHPTIGVQAPLQLAVVEIKTGQVVVGCTYHVAHPQGIPYDTTPVNATDAASRRARRFVPAPVGERLHPVPGPEANPDFPATLDLRRAP